MTAWKTARIESFCTVSAGGTPSRDNIERYYEGGTIPWVKSGELRETIISDTEEHITEAALRETNVKMVPAGALLLAMYGATVGRLGTLGVSATTNQAVCHIIPDPTVAEVRYLFHALSNQVANLVARGVGGAQPNISQRIVRDLAVPLPPLSEQRRVAEILDKADSLRAKRRAALAQLDTLAQSIFLDMFGDPVTNPKAWPIAPLGEKCLIVGEYGANVASTSFDPELPRYVRITDVTPNGDLTEDPVSPAGNESDWNRYELLPGDVLFARSGATVGKTYMHRERNSRCVFAGYLIRFRPDTHELLSDYLFHFTRTAAYGAWVAARQRVVAQPNINAKQYSQELLIPVPPLSLQHEFAGRIGATEAIAVVEHTSRAELDRLFASLQHRAFRGGL